MGLGKRAHHSYWELGKMNVLNSGGRLALALLVAGFLFNGCVSWTHGWDMKPQKASGGLELGAVKEYAARLEKSAVTRDQVRDLISSLEYVLAMEPDNYDVAARLSGAWITMAVGHARDGGEKGNNLRRAISLAEKAMYAAPAFADAVKQTGNKLVGVPLIVGSLEAGQAQAMAMWSLANLLYYEESLSEVMKVTNKDVIANVLTVLDRLDVVSPDYGRGMASALRGMAAAVLPGAKMVNVSDNFDKAVVVGPDVIVNYWLRAVYLYRNFGDKVSAAGDMKKIISIDLNSSCGFMPLNRVIRLAAEKGCR